MIFKVTWLKEPIIISQFFFQINNKNMSFIYIGSREKLGARRTIVLIMSVVITGIYGCANKQSVPEVSGGAPVVASEEVSPEVKKINESNSEEDAWSIAKSTKKALVLSAYMRKYPNGQNSNMAQLRKKLIENGSIN